jgi:hypothetical protein
MMHRSAGKLAALGLVATALGFPGMAGATTVERPGDSKRIMIDDQVGVVDQLEVRDSQFLENSVDVVSVSGVPLVAVPGPFCTQQSPTIVTCQAANDSRIDVSLGGGDDALVHKVLLSGNIAGGDGNDVLTGSNVADTLRGQAGNDRLSGAAGNDVLIGDLGDDVELGGLGDDKVGATGIAQSLNADPGLDTLSGGLGRDDLFSNDGTTDKEINCHGVQGGRDALREVAVVDLVDPQPLFCETVGQAFRDQHPLVQVRGRTVELRGGRAIVRLRCPSAAPGGTCIGRARLVRRGRTIASGRYRLRAGRRRTLRLRLRRRAGGTAEVRTLEKDTEGRPETTRTKVRLKR